MAPVKCVSRPTKSCRRCWQSSSTFPLVDTDARIVETLTHESRLIVTGQIGCGKTTLAAQLAGRLGAAHVRLDQFIGVEDPKSEASATLEAVVGGWVLDGCVWQVPEAAWEAADLAIHLDYANFVHYRRIGRRALRNAVTARSFKEARTVVTDEVGHFRIMGRFADENRRGWREAGGITATPTPVIRCGHPREARSILTRTQVSTGT